MLCAPPLSPPGLNAINISLDTLRPERFRQLTRREGHARVMRAIDRAVELGYDPVKVRAAGAAYGQGQGTERYAP